jgi:hypothetical protein
LKKLIFQNYISIKAVKRNQENEMVYGNRTYITANIEMSLEVANFNVTASMTGL